MENGGFDCVKPPVVRQLVTEWVLKAWEKHHRTLCGTLGVTIHSHIFQTSQVVLWNTNWTPTTVHQTIKTRKMMEKTL